MTKQQLIKQREKIYQILRVNDATNEASWWNIADEVVESISLAIEEREKEIIEEIKKGLPKKKKISNIGKGIAGGSYTHNALLDKINSYLDSLLNK